MRLLLLASRTGVRLPTSPPGALVKRLSRHPVTVVSRVQISYVPSWGCPGFRLGVIGVAVDADICLNANNIVKFERALVTA